MQKKLEQLLYSDKEYSLAMRKQLPITEIVFKSDVVVQKEDRVSVVYRLMKRHRLKHIPVVYQDEVIGIVSRGDIKRLGFGYSYDGRDDIEIGMFDMLQADQVMARNPPKVALDTTVLEVAELMIAKDFAALPVMHEGKVVGVIDIHDLLLFLLLPKGE